MKMKQKSRLSLFHSMRGKLLFWFLLLSLIPVIVVAGVAYFRAQESLQTAAQSKLDAVQAIKKDQLQNYFLELDNDLEVLIKLVGVLRQDAFTRLTTIQSLKEVELQNYFNTLRSQVKILRQTDSLQDEIVAFQVAFEQGGNQVDSPEWRAAARQYSDSLQRLVEENSWHDLILIDPTGRIVFKLDNTDGDLGLSVKGSVLHDTSLGQAFIKLQELDGDEVLFSDFAPYELSDAAYKAFVMTQLRDDSGQLLGYLATEITPKKINRIVQERSGLGDTGETYLATRTTAGNVTLRSDVLSMGDGTYTVGYEPEIIPQYLELALGGKQGENIFIDTDHNPVLASYRPLDVADLNWVLITKINAEEAVVPRVPGSEQDLLAQFAELYGFHDLMLLNANGYVFYSVKQEADYRTNLITGPFSDSHLAEAIVRAKATKEGMLTDIALYAPSNNVPSAFTVQPLVYQNTVEMFAVLQVPLNEINLIMQERTGMGDTGETYLVGPDKRMRSDSFLSPETHSVDASFTGTIAENGVQTTAVERALAGLSGVDIIEDYRGTQVLSVYSPLQLDGLQWALLAEVDVSDAFAAVDNLRNQMLLIGVVVALVVVGAAMGIASSLTMPLNKITAVAQAVSAGDLDMQATVKTNDETRVLADTFNMMITKLREQLQLEQDRKMYLERTVDDYRQFVAHVAEGDLSHRLHLSEQNDDALTSLGHYLNDMVARLRDMTSQIREATNNITSASAEILSAATQQASGANEQSAAISQTTSTITEVKSVVEQAFQKAESVSRKSKQTDEISERGSEAISQTIHSMSEIKDKVSGIAENILALSEQTQQIGEITATVNEIASQSNLLALNASVEAARAGEHGKGFAVVAVEVRNLAEQSRQATDQVKAILNEIQQATNVAVMATEEGTKGVDSGVALTEQAGHTIEQLTDSVTEYTAIARQIVASMQQQNTGMEQISLAMQNINQATMQSLASTRQTERSAQDLSAVARQMESLIDRYKLD